jgi:uncharacterized membrane protein YgaE (UPF0421/DUF939 family)
MTKFSNFYKLYAVKLIVVATMSSFLAYSLSSLFQDFVSPIVAAIIALTGIKPTISDTVKETTRQVTGTFIGAALGLILITNLGFNSLTIIIIVGISLTLGMIIRLDTQSSLAIAATVLLVAGPLLGDFDNVEERAVGVFVGAIFAFVSSLILTQRNPHLKVIQEIRSVNKNNFAVLQEVSDAFRDGKINDKRTAVWLESITANIDKVNQCRHDIQTIYDDARWTPLIKQEEVRQIRGESVAAKATTANIRSIVYAIDNSLSHDITLDRKTQIYVHNLLEELLKSIQSYNKQLKESLVASISEEQAKRIRDKRQRLATRVKKMENAREILLAGTILYEATNIKDNLTE